MVPPVRPEVVGHGASDGLVLVAVVAQAVRRRPRARRLAAVVLLHAEALVDVGEEQAALPAGRRRASFGRRPASQRPAQLVEAQVDALVLRQPVLVVAAQVHLLQEETTRASLFLQTTNTTR